MIAQDKEIVKVILLLTGSNPGNQEQGHRVPQLIQKIQLALDGQHTGQHQGLLQKEPHALRLRKMRSRNSATSKKKSKKSRFPIRLVPWNSKLAISVRGLGNMPKTGRPSTHMTFTNEPDNF